jgi:hypothetical protein
MKVFTVGRDVIPFRFNPLLPPPGFPPGTWLMKLVDVLKHAYFVGEGVEYLLRDAIDRVYEECGLYGGPAKQVLLPVLKGAKIAGLGGSHSFD